MRGKVVVITGATSGIGVVAARRLAAAGARLVLIARDRVRGETALEKGAETLVYRASSHEVAGVSGEYFHDCRRARPSAQACDEAAAARLWLESARLAGIEG